MFEESGNSCSCLLSEFNHRGRNFIADDPNKENHEEKSLPESSDSTEDTNDTPNLDSLSPYASLTFESAKWMHELGICPDMEVWVLGGRFYD